MVARLSRQADAGGQPHTQPHEQQASPGGVAPKGWSKTASAAAQPYREPVTGQREVMQSKLAPPIQDSPSPQEQAGAAFSGAVRQATDAVRQGDYGATGAAVMQDEGRQAEPAPPATRRRRTAAPAPDASHDTSQPHGQNESVVVDTAIIAQAIENAGLMQARAAVLRVVFANPDETVEGGLEIARELMDFVTRG